jgi:hypothetical protein
VKRSVKNNVIHLLHPHLAKRLKNAVNDANRLPLLHHPVKNLKSVKNDVSLQRLFMLPVLMAVLPVYP